MRFSLVGALLTAGLGGVLHAQEPGNPRDKGSVLLLKNGLAMEGAIERIGVQYCVRRGKSEVWIATEKAVRLCADWNDAYAYALAQIKGDDANSRVRLARWCHLHHLPDKALDQARAALILQPDHREAKLLVRQLERAALAPAAKPAPTMTTIPHQPSEPPPSVDVSFETFVGFTTRVQPILMNTCANCHATGHGGKFHLERVYENGRKTTTQRNLARVAAFIDLDRPAISPFLVRAITAHGGAPIPPIKDRSARALQAMQQWVLETVAKNPQLRDYRGLQKLQTPSHGDDSKFGVPIGQKTKAPTQPIVSRGVASTEPMSPRPMPTARPMPVATSPADDWDALHFNRHYHPGR
ncbi:MAG: hypothetical protein HYX68_19480 [Planctomycetes bacterium]|nr:hypothetical protein [Planctomycetota bacterium]